MLNTLKGRLYFLSLLILAPCYAFIYLSFDYSRAIVEEELLKSAMLVSDQAAENQQRSVESTEDFLVSLAAIAQIQKPNSQACQYFVRELTSLFRRYVNIGVPNEKGILTCNGTQLSKPVDVSDRDYIRRAMSENRFTTSGVQIDRAVGNPTINFAYPVVDSRDPSRKVGVVVAVMSLDWWNTLLSSSHLPDKSVAFVLDQDGQAVASYPANTPFDAPEHFLAIWHGKDGINRVFNKHEMRDAEGQVQLTFLTGVAVDESLTRVNDRYTFMVVSFSLMAAVIFIMLRLFFINTVSRPLNRLSDLARRLGRSEPVYSAKSTGVREMDELQNSFVEMAQSKEQVEQKVILQAQTDSLTGIPNRDAFNLKLSDTLFHNQQDNQNFAIILLDLDNFKEVNDTRGHEVGDEVLKQISARFVKHYSTAQSISRMGGDEFIFLLEGEQANPQQVLCLCEEVKQLVKQPCIVPYGEVILSASIGIALYPDDGKNIRELMGAADQAMYHAKQSGRDTIRRFNWDLKEALVHKMELMKDLRQAIVNQEFYLVYQPIIDRQGKITKFEALIRWSHPEKGLISPDQFISFAEESGQIVEIGDWVICEAQHALQQIRKVHGEHIQISVNVSPIQLSKQQGENGEFMGSLLTYHNGRRGSEALNGLVVEITENLLMNLDENTRQALLDFREKGIQVALDDFGTGYSSLAYIMNYDIDYLKIDKSFVQKLDDESSSLSLCEAIISMAHKLGVAVIAEGVETQEQVDLLMEYGCDYLQGFYFSRPLALDQTLIYQQDKLFAVI